MRTMILMAGLLACHLSHAQITTVRVDSKMTDYGLCNVLYYKAHSTVPLPKTVVFIPGMAQHQSPEKAGGTDGLLNNEGPLPFILHKNWRPNYNIIVLQPSKAGDDFITSDGQLGLAAEQRCYAFIKNMLAFLVQQKTDADYPSVTKDGIYLTGLSLGAHYIHSYVKHLTTNDIKPQAMVTMSIAMPLSLDGYTNFEGIPAWAFIGDKDVDVVTADKYYMKDGQSFYSTMSGFWHLMKNTGWPNKRLTIYDGAHESTVSADGQKGWQYFYNTYNQFPEYTVPAFSLVQQTLSNQVSIYDWMLSYPQLTPLPVRFHSFTVQHINTETILQWSTSSETNNAYFVVERSEDGILYEEVGRIPSKAPGGHSSSILNYIFKLFSK